MNNPCINCTIVFDDFCYCEKKSAYEAYQQGKKDAIDKCIKTVEEIIADCIENGGCRSKCDEPYVCVYGIDVKANIEQLKEELENEN